MKVEIEFKKPKSVAKKEWDNLSDSEKVYMYYYELFYNRIQDHLKKHDGEFAKFFASIVSESQK